MPTLEEQLLDVQEQLTESEQEVAKFSRIHFYENLVNFLNLLISYLIVVGAFSLICLYNVWPKSISNGNWWTVIITAIWPGGFLVYLLFDFFEKPLDKLKYKLARINKNEYNVLKNKAWDLKKKNEEILREIRQEKIRIEREINKAKEYKLINNLNDAVYKIQRKQLAFPAASYLYNELKQEYDSITTLYYHTARYYHNRFNKISSALRRYDDINISIPNPIKIENKNNDISTEEKPIIKTESSIVVDKPIVKVEPPVVPEKKVEPFSRTYKPISTTNTPVAKIEAPKPVVKVEPPAIIENPIVVDKPIEKPIVKAEPSVIKENAANTAESPIEELFAKKDVIETTKPKEKQDRVPAKIDYKKLYEKKQDLGSLGEIFAFEWELNRLVKNGKDIEKVIHASLTNDSLGYDILSVTEDGATKFIEVKTTTGSVDTPFYMSETEVNAMKTLKNYFIYRLHKFDIETGTSFVTIIDSENGNDNLDFQPTTYRVSPK